MSAALGFILTEEQAAFAHEHVRLAYREAHKMARSTGIAYDDLQGPAIIGLCKAAATYDAKLGWKPSTYLCPKIRGELLHYVRDKTYLLRIPHRTRELWMRGRKHIPFGRADAWIAKECEVSLAEWLECRCICSGPPVELNEGVQFHPATGEHGQNNEKEDDRTGAFEAAAAASWYAHPREANSLFWGIKGLKSPAVRQAAVETIISTALDAMGSGNLPAPVTPSLAAATYDVEQPEPLLLIEALNHTDRLGQLSIFVEP